MVNEARLPVIVGVSQVTQRVTDFAQAAEPLALMIQSVRQAADDARSKALLERAGLVVVVRGAWNYADPGRLIAEAIGASSARTALTAEGGNAPQHAITEVAQRIVDGHLDAAVIVGGEGIYTRRKCREAGIERTVTVQRDATPDEQFGDTSPMSSQAEQERGLTAPLYFYALFESAIRAERGESISDHRTRVAQMLYRFNAVAATNPLAWSPQRLSVEQIRDESPDNPMVAFPYTKRMCSNWFTDQAAAVLICSTELAQRLQIPQERWVYPHSGTAASDTRYVSGRASLARSPAIRIAGRRALELAGVSLDQVKHIDVYSCFPSAVQVAVRELDIPQSRSLTLTGGLSYFGGPLANYVTHSVATMVDVLRGHPGDRGLITANGGYLTKHGFAVYSTEPPARFCSADLQDEVDACSAPLADAGRYVGDAEVESTTVLFAKGQAATALISCRTPDGGRVFARSADPQLLGAATQVELAGKRAVIAADATATVPSVG